MTILLIALRILHVLGGVFWVGAALAMNLFINPSLRATAESGQKVTAHLMTQTKFFLALIVSSAATVIAGTWLYWIDSNGFSYGWMNTATGITFGVGGLFAFVGWGTGFVLSRTGAAAGQLAGQIRGAGFDSLIASRLVGPLGRVVGFDMTDEMLKKARAGAEAMGAANVEFREGLAESLPLPDGFAEVVISNGVLNLMLDKTETLREWFRILKPGGRLHEKD